MASVLHSLPIIDDDALIDSALGHTEAALAALGERILAEPNRALVWTSLGIARARAGDFDSAVSAFQRALELAPGHVLSSAYLGSCLHLAGREGESGEVLDFEDMIEIAELQPGATASEVDAFNVELAEHVFGDPTLTWELTDKAIRGGFQTQELLNSDAPEVMSRFQTHLNRHLRRLLSPDDNSPAWTLTAWGVSLRSGGYQLPHVHPRGLLSGVYYVQVPPPGEQSNAGALRFRRQLPWLPCPAHVRASEFRAVLPHPGMLIVFPSYFWHETVPFESDTARISIAFDVLPPALE